MCIFIVRRTFTFDLVYPLRGIGCVCFHFLLIYIPYGEKLIINKMYMCMQLLIRISNMFFPDHIQLNIL